MKKPKKINFFAIGKKVISNEIDALQEVSSGISKNEFNNVCNFLLETKWNLIFLGIGKSGKVSEKISATLSSLGKPSFYINAAEASHGDLGAITKKDSLIIFSNISDVLGECSEGFKITVFPADTAPMIGDIDSWNG